RSMWRASPPSGAGRWDPPRTARVTEAWEVSVAARKPRAVQVASSLSWAIGTARWSALYPAGPSAVREGDAVGGRKPHLLRVLGGRRGEAGAQCDGGEQAVDEADGGPPPPHGVPGEHRRRCHDRELTQARVG